MTPLPRHDHYIAGEWTKPASGEYFPSLNPTTAQPWYEAANGTAEDVDRAVRAARTAFEDPRWRDLSQTRRGRLLRDLADLIGEHAEELARTETLDNGKLLREMRAQLAGLPEYFHYYAGLADKIHGEVIPGASRDLLNYTLREPVGVVGAITPWNSPLLLTATKLAPALAAGNTVVVKPSEHTSASLLALAPLFEEAGFPPGVVNVVTGFGPTAGGPLTEHPDVAKVTFTGSTETGRRIARTCADRFVRCTLELGGKSPNIVFPDADLASASMGVIAGIFAAAGQTCVAGSRVLVHEDVYDEVLERVTARAATIRIGDDPARPVAELADTLVSLVEAGYVRRVGASNWRAERLSALVVELAERGHTPVASYQFSLAEPDPALLGGSLHADRAVMDVVRENRLPLLAWSSQARGFFARDEAPRADSRPDPYDTDGSCAPAASSTSPSPAGRSTSYGGWWTGSARACCGPTPGSPSRRSSSASCSAPGRVR
ncbi:aldehyde dehydrogenase family protein [Streptomyces sp. NPDC005921]